MIPRPSVVVRRKTIQASPLNNVFVREQMVFLRSLFYGKQRASKVWTGFGSDRLKEAGSFLPDLRIAAYI